MSFLDDLKESVSSMSLEEVIAIQKDIQSRRCKIAEKRARTPTKRNPPSLISKMSQDELQEAINKLKEIADAAN